jgi:hypothetical protein
MYSLSRPRLFPIEQRTRDGLSTESPVDTNFTENPIETAVETSHLLVLYRKGDDF